MGYSRVGSSHEKLSNAQLYSTRLSNKQRVLYIKERGNLYFVDYLPEHEYDASPWCRHKASRLKELIGAGQFEVLPDEFVGVGVGAGTGTVTSVDESAAFKEESFFWNNGRQILLSDAQEQLLAMRFPALVSGPPGAGKTVVAQLLLKLHAEQGRQTVYLTLKPGLVESVKQNLASSGDVDEAHIAFKTYDTFLLEHQKDALAVIQLDASTPEIIAWSNLDYVQAVLKKYVLSLEALIQRFKFLDRESDLEWCADLCERLKKHCRAQGKVISELERVDRPKEAVESIYVIDEAQLFSSVQLENVLSCAKGQICLFIGDHQGPEISIVKKVKAFFHKEGQALNQWRLSDHFRCPGAVSRLANVLIDIKQQYTGGAIEKGVAMLLPRLESDAYEGVEIISPTAGLAHLQERAANRVIVTLAKYLEEAKAKFPDVSVYLLSDIQGLEFDYVIAYKIFQGSELIGKLKAAASVKPAAAGAQAKRGLGDVSFEPLFNALIIAVTRAKVCLTIVDSVLKSRLEAFASLKKFLIELSDREKKPAYVLKDSLEDWLFGLHEALRTSNDIYKEKAAQVIDLKITEMLQAYQEKDLFNLTDQDLGEIRFFLKTLLNYPDRLKERLLGHKGLLEWIDRLVVFPLTRSILLDLILDIEIVADLKNALFYHALNRNAQKDLFCAMPRYQEALAFLKQPQKAMKPPLKVSGGHVVEGLRINNAYLYEDTDVTAILNARSEGRAALKIMAAIDTIGGRRHLEQRLRECVAQGDRSEHWVIIPCNIGQFHWVGLRFLFNHNQCVRAEYLDSLGRDVFVGLQRQLSAVFPEVVLERVRVKFLQDDSSSCGPCMIENLLDFSESGLEAGESVSMETLRARQIEALQEYSSEASISEREKASRQAFYQRFKYRQAHNILSFNVGDVFGVLSKDVARSEAELEVIACVASLILNVQNQQVNVWIQEVGQLFADQASSEVILSKVRQGLDIHRAHFASDLYRYIFGLPLTAISDIEACPWILSFDDLKTIFLLCQPSHVLKDIAPEVAVSKKVVSAESIVDDVLLNKLKAFDDYLTSLGLVGQKKVAKTKKKSGKKASKKPGKMKPPFTIDMTGLPLEELRLYIAQNASVADEYYQVIKSIFLKSNDYLAGQKDDKIKFMLAAFLGGLSQKESDYSDIVDKLAGLTLGERLPSSGRLPSGELLSFPQLYLLAIAPAYFFGKKREDFRVLNANAAIISLFRDYPSEVETLPYFSRLVCQMFKREECQLNHFSFAMVSLLMQFIKKDQELYDQIVIQLKKKGPASGVFLVEVLFYTPEEFKALFELVSKDQGVRESFASALTAKSEFNWTAIHASVPKGSQVLLELAGKYKEVREAWISVLNQKGKAHASQPDDYTPAVLLAQHAPEGLKLLLELAKTDGAVSARVAEALIQQNQDGWNLLYFVAPHAPEGLKALFEWAKTDEAVRASVTKALTQKNKDDWNLLHYAARHAPEGLKVLLELASTDEAVRASVADALIQRDRNDQNPLHFAVLHAPEGLKALLELAKTDAEVRKNLAESLIQQDRNGHNPQHFAAKCAPEGLKVLLEWAKTDEAVRKRVAEALIQKSRNGWNPVHAAVLHAPEGLKALLELAKTDAEVRKNLAESLIQQSKTGWNPVHLAARYAPGGLKALFEWAKTDEAVMKSVAKALIQQEKDGWNPLHLVARYAPEGFTALLELFGQNEAEREVFAAVVSQNLVNGCTLFHLLGLYNIKGLKDLLAMSLKYSCVCEQASAALLMFDFSPLSLLHIVIEKDLSVLKDFLILARMNEDFKLNFLCALFKINAEKEIASNSALKMILKLAPCYILDILNLLLNYKGRAHQSQDWQEKDIAVILSLQTVEGKTILSSALSERIQIFDELLEFACGSLVVAEALGQFLSVGFLHDSKLDQVQMSKLLQLMKKCPDIWINKISAMLQSRDLDGNNGLMSLVRGDTGLQKFKLLSEDMLRYPVLKEAVLALLAVKNNHNESALDLIKQKQLDIPVMWHPQVQIMLRGPVLLLDLGVERRAHP